MCAQRATYALILALKHSRIECPRDIIKVIASFIQSPEAASARLWEFLIKSEMNIICDDMRYKLRCQIEDHHSDPIKIINGPEWFDYRYHICNYHMSYVVNVDRGILIVDQITTYDRQFGPQNNYARYKGKQLLLYI